MSKKTAVLNIVGVMVAGLISISQVQAANHGAAVNVEDAYVRMPIPGRTMSAAFMKLENTSDQKRVLTSAKADWAKSIEIHTHTHENGVMKMREILSLELPAGKTVELEPGGLHLMLFGLHSELPAKPQLSLCYQDGHCQQVTAELKDMRK